MTYTIYTLGGGDMLVGVLNAVASGVGQDSFHSLCRLAVLFGLVWVLCRLIMQSNPLGLLSWFFSVYILYNLLLVPKMTIEVNDPLSNKKTLVANVPLGVGLVGSVASTLGEGLTRLFEPLFDVPDGLAYSTTGFVMGARLIEESHKIHVTNLDFSKALQGFIQQCVMYDLARGKYSLKALLMATETEGDVWAFIKKKASPLQAFPQGAKMVTCKEGADTFDEAWKNAIKVAGTQLGQRVLGKAEQETAIKAIIAELPIALNYLTGLSQTSTQIIQHNLLINAIHDTLSNKGAALDAVAAVNHYAELRANQTLRSQFTIGGELATHWLPIAKNVIEALLIGGFLLVVLLMLLPGGSRTLLAYTKSLVWIELWAPLFAILHGMMLTVAKANSTAMVNDIEMSGLNALTWSGLANINHDIALYAGFATLLIPLIAWGLVNGAGFAVTTLASYGVGAIQGGVQRAAEEVTSGNLSFGNVNYDNHSAHNVSANHFEVSARSQMLGFTEQLAGGSQVTSMPDGGVVMDNHPGLSHLAVSGDFAKRLSAVSQQQREASLSAMESDRYHYSDGVTQAAHYFTELSEAFSKNTDQSHLDQFADTQRTVDALQFLDQMIDKFAESQQTSRSDAAQLLQEGYFDFHLGYKGKWGGVNGGGKFAASLTKNVDQQRLKQHATEFMKENQVQKTMETAIQGLQEWSHRQNDETSHRLSMQLSSAFDQIKTAQHDLEFHWQEANGYHALAQSAREDSFSMNAHADQAFMRWLNDTSGLSLAETENMLLHEPTRAHQYWEQFAQHEITQLMQQVPSRAEVTRTLKAKHDQQNVRYAEKLAEARTDNQQKGNTLMETWKKTSE
jgi:conjugal transfer mating pair stabilization protein TraG